ncbi:DUF882 domain-containing protein [Roseibium sp. H3510]|uniref:Murein endopeptidase K n=1 Tax=Roseibium algae TaxID=3123038 RepID=A0ABU8TG20_9HYPH
MANAETRTLKLYNTHTKERVSITFKKNGRYIPSGLREANRFLRDWRRNEMTTIDPKLLDLVWEVYQKVRAKKPIYVVSSYRSPATNNMLRKRSRGVAKNSQHTLGKAMDFYIPGVKLATLRAAGLRKQVGGVGYYPRSGSPFVHMDTGNVRHWPKMSRSQLAKVFPNGKTLHVPSDGKPLKGYKLALAESKSGKSRSSKPTVVASSTAPPRAKANSTVDQSLNNAGDRVRPVPAGKNSSGGNLLASLFKSDTSNSARSRVAAVRPTNAPLPPGSLTGTRRAASNASIATAAAPVTQAPPIPDLKTATTPETPPATAQEPFVFANVFPTAKPAVAIAKPLQVASIAPNTLDSQRVSLEQGQPPATTPARRFDFATAAPSQKPGDELVKAAEVAALSQPNFSGRIPIPRALPASDPAAAIIAATGGTARGDTKPTITPSTLAYASTLPSSLATTPNRKAQIAMAKAATKQAERASATKHSVSGRIPLAEIKDPLAGFAGLPDKSEPRLISSKTTTRNRLFASMSHPDQRTLENFLSPGNRFVSNGFELFPYGALKSDRFDGPAVVVLPVTFAR